MTTIVFIVEALTISALYNTAFEKQREQLEATVRGQATLISAVADFDSHFSQGDHAAGALGATLSQVKDAHKRYKGFGETGEFNIGKLEGNKVNFISRSRYTKSQEIKETQITMGSLIAIPMQRALSGKSGTIIGKDYRGKVVLAAYEPINILNYGIVVKIDLDEVRAPYVKMALMSMFIAFILIISGAFIFRKITDPMLKHMRDSESYNRMLFESSPIGLAFCSMDGTLIDINQSYADIIGRSIEETKSLTYWDITPIEYSDNETEQLEKLKQVGHYGPYEKEYIHKNGNRVAVSLLGQLVERDGKKYIWSSVENITGRTKAEKELERIFELSLDLVGMGNLQGYFTKINSSFKRILGYSNEEILARPFIDFVFEDDVESTLAALSKAAEGKQDFRIVNRYKCKNGDIKWFEWNVLSVPDENVFFSSGRDITERRNTEQVLEQSTSRLNEAQRIAKVGSWELDLLNNVLSWSDEIFHMFEIDKSKFDASYEAFLNAIHEDDRDRVNQSYTDSLADRKPYEIVHRLKMSDGTIKHVRENCESYFDPDNKPIRSVGTVQDLTEQVEYANALRESEEKFRSTFEQAAVGVAQVSPEGGWLKVNQKLCSIIGYSEEELLGKTFQDITHPDDLQNDLAYVNQILNGELDTYSMEKRYIKKGGVIIWIYLTVSLVKNADGTPKYFISIVEDINDRKITETELNKYRNHLEELVNERTQELKNTQDELVRKERLATLGQLTATVSHELRNPLGAMRPSLYIIEKKCDKTDEQVQNAIERIDRNIERCDRTIDELLDFTRITELHREPTQVDEWLESVIDEQQLPDEIYLKKEFSIKDIELTIDSDRLRRAIINVFENACHAMMEDNKKVVNIENAILGIKTTIKNERVEIIISDTGSGIADNVLDKIYEPLFSTKGFGVGLGMPTVKQIMQQHSGGIEIETQKGKGTSVILWLPLNTNSQDVKAG